MPQPARPNQNDLASHAPPSARDADFAPGQPAHFSSQASETAGPTPESWDSASTAVIQLTLEGAIVQFNDAAKLLPLVKSLAPHTTLVDSSLLEFDPQLHGDLRTLAQERRLPPRKLLVQDQVVWRRLQLVPHPSLPSTGYLLQYQRRTADETDAHLPTGTLPGTELWRTLSSLAAQALAGLSSEDFFAATVSEVAQHLQAQRVELYRLNVDHSELRCLSRWGPKATSEPRSVSTDEAESILVAASRADRAIMSRESIGEVLEDESLLVDPALTTAELFARIAGLEGAAGLLHVRWEDEHRISSDQQYFLIAVAHLLAENFHREAIQLQLREIKTRLEFTLNTARIGTWTLRLSDLTSTRSARHDEIFGYAQMLPQWTYAMFLDHVVPVDREAVNRILEAGIREKSSWRFECRIHRADGKLRWIWVEGTTICSQDNHPDAMTGLVVDITERKEAELSLRETEERLRLATEATDLGTWDLDPETGNMIVSDRFRSIWKIPPETPVTYDMAVAMIHPDDRMHVRSTVQKSLNPRESGHYDVEHRLVAPPGEPERWIRATGRVYFDKHNATRFVGTVEDITEDKRAEQAITERLKLAERLNHIAQTVPGLIYSFEIDEHGMARFPFVGPQVSEIFGTTADELRRDAAGVFARIHSQDIDRVRNSIEASRQSGGEWHEQYRYHHPERGEVWLEAKSAPQHRTIGPVAWHGFVQDITEQKLAELKLAAAQQAAEAASRSKSEFLANMSHEIRTPMTAILGYTDLLDEREDDPHKAKFLRTIRRNGKYLLDILNDILDISKIEAGKFELDQEKIALATLISDVYAMMYVRAEEKGIKLQIEFPTRLPEVVVSDSKRLRQVLINLLSNAIKFTSVGFVKLATRYDADANPPEIVIEVRDSGIGIPADLLPRLFEPFYQGDASVTRQFGGTGLGLAISQRLANMLGGMISVQSEAGIGSCFTFRFVANIDRDTRLIQPRLEATEETHDDAVPPPQLDCRILVVDDRRDVRYLVRYILLKAGAAVEMAEDGIEAIEMVSQAIERQNQYDLILLDMQMPRLDGYQAAPQLRQLGFGGPIIALTADVLEQDKTNCLTQGCTAFLRKPIDSRELLALVERLTK